MAELAKLGHETHRRHLELAILELETLVRRGEVEDDLVECRGGKGTSGRGRSVSLGGSGRAREIRRLGLVGGGFERICIGGWVARVSRARALLLDFVAVARDSLARVCRLRASPRRGREVLGRQEHDEQDETEDVSPGLLRLALRERRGGRRDEHRDERARVTRLTNVRDGRGRRDARTGVKGLTGRGALAAHSTGTGARPTFVNGTAKKYFRRAAPRARQSARPTNIGTVYTRTRARARRRDGSPWVHPPTATPLSPRTIEACATPPPRISRTRRAPSSPRAP